MIYQPIGDYIVVERPRSPNETSGGIIVPEIAKKKQTRGVVLAVGPGAIGKNGQRKPIPLKVGDSVLFTQHDVRKHKHEGRDYVFLKADEVLAVLEGASDSEHIRIA